MIKPSIEIPLLIALGAAVGIGCLLLLVDLLPLIAIGGVGFLIWKLSSFFKLQEEP